MSGGMRLRIGAAVGFSLAAAGLGWSAIDRLDPGFGGRGAGGLGFGDRGGLSGAPGFVTPADRPKFITPPDAPIASGVPDAAGRARVIDGDTLEVAGRKIRLEAIDAPETDQNCTDAAGRAYACGDRARAALDGFLRGRRVVCAGEASDRYGRLLAICRVGDGDGDGVDLGAWMIGQGWALAYRRYSARYGDAEDAARAAGAGMWAGGFTPPWEHRSAQRVAARRGAPTALRNAPDAGCVIKGNISKNGRIYHVPGSRAYARTRISTARGERWFCSESEALSAGWRPPHG